MWIWPRLNLTQWIYPDVDFIVDLAAVGLVGGTRGSAGWDLVTVGLKDALWASGSG